jgi:cytochrome b561
MRTGFGGRRAADTELNQRIAVEVESKVLMNSAHSTAATPLSSSAPEVYSRTAVALHWVIFGLISATFAMGWVMTEMAVSPRSCACSTGISGPASPYLPSPAAIWRLTHPAASLPCRLAGQAAHTLHRLLYADVRHPLSGWAYSNASGAIPSCISASSGCRTWWRRTASWARPLLEVHEVLGWVLVALVVACAGRAQASFHRQGCHLASYDQLARVVKQRHKP